MYAIGRFAVIGEHVAAPEGLLPIRLLPAGTHAKGWGWEPDTRAALDWLAERVEPGMTVADIGTGTGILAIAATRLGGVITAYEQDESVRTIAMENFALNEIDVDLYPEYDDRQGFDLVVANLGDVVYAKMLTAGREVWTSG